MAEKLALLFLDEKDDEREKAVITYGIEVVLNELLKSILILVLGIVFGKTLVAVIGLVYLLIIRRYLGGRHFNSNIMCTMFTVFTAFLGPVLVMMIIIPFVVLIVAAILLTLTIFIMNLYSEDEPLSPEKVKKNKLVSILIFWVAGLLAYVFGKDSYLSEILFIELVAVVFAFDK